MSLFCQQPSEIVIFNQGPFWRRFWSSQLGAATGVWWIRLLTIRILSHFEVRLPELMEDDGLSERQSVFTILRQAELVPATVNDYREKLLHLRKLRHDVVQTAVPDGPLQEMPLRYLLGMLYVNFSALWDPVIELIRIFSFICFISLSFHCSNEYYPADLQVAPTQDLRRKGRGLGAEEIEEEPVAGEDEELGEELAPQDEPSQKKKTRRAAAK
ncbi:hypothetical protein J1605_020284 [Eschrichtius robustus]|uniref:Uncharacterized protein n=1 Tax=Eschrichtius robustus TaxID=9764 RepID=A0AB34HJC6_ESCRO|nr:hypothetical protein J1605_020284 [Eschrichtius robustus]